MARRKVATGPRLQQRYEWLALAAEPYGGFHVRLWTNYPPSLTKEIYCGDTARALAALLQIVVEHNGWQDHEGKPYQPAGMQAFWDAIPNELFRLILLAIEVAPTLLTGNLSREQAAVMVHRG